MNTSKLGVKEILFDLVGVLLFKKADYQPDPTIDQIDRLIGKVTDDRVFAAETKRKFDLDDMGFNSVLQKIADKYEKFVPLWTSLPRLHKQVRLGIINNGTALTWPYFDKRFELSRQFDMCLNSARTGVAKPDVRIYQLAAEKLQLAPQEILFMDDLEENIIGAKNVGMQTIWWKDSQTGMAEFKKLLKI